MKRFELFTALLAVLASSVASADVVYGESPRTSAFELKLGNYQPRIDGEAGLSGTPFTATFGTSGMLLVEMEYDWQLFQKFGRRLSEHRSVTPRSTGTQSRTLGRSPQRRPVSSSCR